jgi:hypothetical protein
MESVFTKSNLIKAGAATVAAMLAMKLTANQSKLIQGGAAVLAVAVALPLSAKIG